MCKKEISYEELLEQLRQSRSHLVFVYEGELQTPPILKRPISLFFGPSDDHAVRLDVGFTDFSIVVSHGKTYFQLIDAELGQSLTQNQPNLEDILLTGVTYIRQQFLIKALQQVGLHHATYRFIDENNQNLPFKLEWLSINGLPYIIK